MKDKELRQLLIFNGFIEPKITQYGDYYLSPKISNREIDTMRNKIKSLEQQVRDLKYGAANLMKYLKLEVVPEGTIGKIKE